MKKQLKHKKTYSTSESYLGGGVETVADKPLPSSLIALTYLIFLFLSKHVFLHTVITLQQKTQNVPIIKKFDII